MTKLLNPGLRVFYSIWKFHPLKVVSRNDKPYTNSSEWQLFIIPVHVIFVKFLSKIILILQTKACTHVSNFHLLKVVGCGSDTQLQVNENLKW